jgi:glutamine synthetase
MSDDRFTYALANPLSVILDKSPQDFTRANFLKIIDQKHIERISFHYTALDSILSRAGQVFRHNSGLELQALGELEFFLLSDRNRSLYPAQKQQGYQSAAPFLKSGQILNEMVHHITQITGAVKYAHSEVGFVESVRSDLPADDHLHETRKIMPRDLHRH